MDYKVDGPIVFLPGSSDNDKSTECFIVNIIDDDIVEGTKVFILNLTVNSSGCRIAGDPPSNGEVELTIIDDPTDGMLYKNDSYHLNHDTIAYIGSSKMLILLHVFGMLWFLYTESKTCKISKDINFVCFLS